MKIFDLLSMSIKNLTRRKFRTSMTIMGVVIGTTAIISMVSLGLGISQSYDDFLSSFGNLTILDVYLNSPDVLLNEETLQTFLEIDGTETVTPFQNFPIYEGGVHAGRNGRYVAQMHNLIGVYPDALEKMDYSIETGKLMEQGSKKIQIVAGTKVAYNFEDDKRKGSARYISPYPDQVTGEIPDPFFNLEQEKDLQMVLLYGENLDKELVYDIEVVGTLKDGGENSYDTQFNMYMDIRDMEKVYKDYMKISGSRDRKGLLYDYVRLKVRDIEKVSEIADALTDMGFWANNPEKQRQDAMQQAQMIQLILGGLGGISLFVAAISIANTMVMSVYERTREIGIMKVLGCFVSDIRTTFLIEASLIGFVGGILGILLSFLISFLLNRYGGAVGAAMGMMDFGGTAKLSIIPPWLALLGLGFSTGVGIISGFYPAYRAVKISALEAIKQE